MKGDLITLSKLKAAWFFQSCTSCKSCQSWQRLNVDDEAEGACLLNAEYPAHIN